MDLAYYGYLVQAVPPREILRALAARARRALRGNRPLLLEERPRPLRVLDPRPGLFGTAVPAAREEILAEAEAALRGELRLFGRRIACGSPIDYHRDPFAPGVRYDPAVPGELLDVFQQGKDAKALWEIGRLSFLWPLAQTFRLTSDPKWSQAWASALRGFDAANPAGLGVQWSCPMEVSLRAMNVALTSGLVGEDGEWLHGFLDRHCAWVASHLEETGAVLTNHYAADLTGLVVVGALFPSLRGYYDAFAKKLWDQVERQCRPDGTHFESATSYQRLCAELFLAAVLAARAAALDVPPAVEHAVRGLFRSLACTLKPSGKMPQIGDLDSCRPLPLWPRAALDASPVADASAPEWEWLPGGRSFVAAPAQRSALLPDGGIAVLRSGEGWLCLSAGPNGQGGTGGHAHNDKNSVELSFGSFDVLVDRGTHVYARDPADRNARRGTAGHNTVQVDGLEQNRIVPGRLFALPDRTRARVTELARRSGFEIAAGEHRGYERAGIVHRRIAALGEDCAAFVDELRGQGEHLFLARWFVPHEQVEQRAATAEEAERLERIHQAGLTFGYDLGRCLLVGGRALFAFGATLPWTLRVTPTDVSPGYAEKLPARCLSLELAGAAPARVFTAVLFLRHP